MTRRKKLARRVESSRLVRSLGPPVLSLIQLVGPAIRTKAFRVSPKKHNIIIMIITMKSLFYLATSLPFDSPNVTEVWQVSLNDVTSGLICPAPLSMEH